MFSFDNQIKDFGSWMVESIIHEDQYGILAESLTNDVNKNLKFGVCIATHKIEQGNRDKYMTTPEVLKECLDSIKSQTYENWKVYICGDAYPDVEEVNEVLKEYGNKIQFHNLSKPGERDRGLTNEQIWATGGVKAINKALSMAEKDGVDVIVRIDHDDKWGKNHLMTLAKAYTQYPESIFAFTKAVKKPTGGSTNKRVMYLPGKVKMNKVEYNNLFAPGGDVSHSAVSWKVSNSVLKGLRYRGVEEQCSSEPKFTKNTIRPADMDIYDRIRRAIDGTENKYIYVPELTSYYRNNKGEFANR
jgi:glycosyltransferase involved in cell wall biosynthesis